MYVTFPDNVSNDVLMLSCTFALSFIKSFPPEVLNWTAEVSLAFLSFSDRVDFFPWEPDGPAAGLGSLTTGFLDFFLSSANALTQPDLEPTSAPLSSVTGISEVEIAFVTLESVSAAEDSEN